MGLKFSIITPSYNQGNFIENTIKSVLKQNVELEYWVIDGGSTDQTLEILKKYKKKYKNFNFVSEPDLGQSDAINKGIKKSRGEIIAYLNSDDLYLPNALKTIELIALTNTKHMWFYGRSIIINVHGEKIQSFFSKIKNFLGKKYSYQKLLSFNIISQPAVFLRKKIFDNIGYFDEKNHWVMDYEFWLRIGKIYPGFPVLQNLAQFRYHMESKTNQNFFRQYWKEFRIAFAYSNKLKNLPSIIIHLIHYFLVVLWIKFIFK